jgi:hypothetical protein
MDRGQARLLPDENWRCLRHGRGCRHQCDGQLSSRAPEFSPPSAWCSRLLALFQDADMMVCSLPAARLLGGRVRCRAHLPLPSRCSGGMCRGSVQTRQTGVLCQRRARVSCRWRHLPAQACCSLRSWVPGERERLPSGAAICPSRTMRRCSPILPGGLSADTGADTRPRRSTVACSWASVYGSAIGLPATLSKTEETRPVLRFLWFFLALMTGKERHSTRRSGNTRSLSVRVVLAVMWA